MRAIELSAPRRAGLVEMPAPVPAPGEVVIRIDATGLCGSDVSTWQGHHPFRRPPVVLGHEAAGTVVAVAPDVTTVGIGTRVALCPLIACGACPSCRRGATNLCRHRRVPGVGWNGTYADYIAAPADRAFVVADGVDAIDAALIEPAAVALRACRRAGVEAGSKVGILGAGGIGFMCALIAKLSGVITLAVTDLQSEKLTRVAAVTGARAVLVPAEDPVSVAQELTDGDGLDAVIVTSAGGNVIDQAIAMTRPGGSVVLVALPGRPTPIGIDAAVVGEVDLLGSYVYSDRDFADAVDLVGRGGLDVRAALTHTPNLEEAPAIFDQIADGLDYTKIVFVTNQAPHRSGVTA